MLRAWLWHEGVIASPEAIHECYAWMAAFAVSMLIVYAWIWLAFRCTPYYRKLPRLAIPVCAAWAYALSTAPLLWRESTWWSDCLRYGWEILGPPLLVLLLVYRCRTALGYSWDFAWWLGLSTGVISVLAYWAGMNTAWNLIYGG